MSTLRRRLETMKALTVSSTEIAASPTTQAAIKWEFDEALSAGNLSFGSRRFLLQVLHSTRALDTFLSSFLSFHAIVPGKSLRNHLNNLEGYTGNSFSRLPGGRAQYYQNTVIDSRNKYMHQAGTSPQDHFEMVTLLTEMQKCFSEVLSL